MHNDIDNDDKQQIIVTLALIQKALKDNSERVNDHHKVLFGNGNPENSIVWAIKKLTESIDKLEKQLEVYHKQEMEVSAKAQSDTDHNKKEMELLKNNDANLSWTQWFKKISMKWLPVFVVIIIMLIMFNKPITQILLAWSKII